MHWSIRKKIFLILFFSLACIVLVGSLQANRIHTIIVSELGANLGKSHIQWQKERLKGAIERELSLCGAMSSSETIQHWALNESDIRARSAALEELENFRTFFRSGSWFAVFDKTKNYYYSDSPKNSQSIIPLKTLVPRQEKDAWYFITLKNKQGFTLNVDYDKEVGKTNLWINMIMKRDGVPIGIIGTGLDITTFIRELVVTPGNNIHSYILNKDGSIFVSRDKRNMNMRILAKDDAERKKIFALVPEANRVQLRKAMESVVADPKKIVALETTFDNEPRIVALSYIPSTHWVVLSTIDAKNIFETKNIITSVLVILAAAAFILLLFSLLIDKLVITPVQELKRGADSLRNGDYSTRFSTRQSDEIGELKSTFNVMAEEIEANVNLLEQRVRERTEELAKSRNKISTLLNSSGEGFLKFNAELIVDDEYSSECRAIFTKDITGHSIHDLLFDQDAGRRDSFVKIIEGINKQSKKFLKEVMLDLLPDEVQLGEHYYNLRFLLGSEEAYILIMKDITAQKQLTRKIEESERRLSFVVEFIKEEITAKDLIAEFRKFLKGIEGYEGAEISHKLHTFKGNFLQKGFIHLPPVIHQEEGRLQSNRDTGKDEIDTASLQQGLENDIAILTHYLGDQAMGGTGIKISLDRLLSLAAQAKEVSDELYTSISVLLQTPLRDCLQQFEKTIRRIAEDEGKEVEYRLDCPADITIFYPDYSNALTSMYHLITNAVTHGIETPEARSAKGKDEKGRISVTAGVDNRRLVITVSDDGKGIAHGFENDEAVTSPYDRIFEDGVTSSATVDYTSGRGVGMGSVKSEVENIGGTIDVSSSKDTGTSITISIPVKE